MIKELLLQLLQGEEIYSKVCKVDAVNGMTCNVTPIDGDAPVNDVRIVADINSQNKWVPIPKVGSFVVVSFLTKDIGYVSMVSEVSELYYKNGTTVMQVNDKFLFQHGSDTLKQVIQLIIESVQVITVMYGNNPDYTKLTQALTKLNNLLS
jgi:hypothetical protein